MFNGGKLFFKITKRTFNMGGYVVEIWPFGGNPDIFSIFFVDW